MECAGVIDPRPVVGIDALESEGEAARGLVGRVESPVKREEKIDDGDTVAGDTRLGFRVWRPVPALEIDGRHGEERLLGVGPVPAIPGARAR